MFEDNASITAQAERRTKWSFFILADGSWIWRILHPDSTEACADKSFATLMDCKSDAERHGYVAVSSDAERRRERPGSVGQVPL